MKKLATILAILFIGFSAKSQHTADIGVLVSGAGYWGDIEKVNYSKSITPVIGALGRWNFNKRLAVRGQLTTGNLKAVGTFPDAYIYTPDGVRNTSGYFKPGTDEFFFQRSIQSVEALFEFNFFNYKMGSTKKENITPFVAIGAGAFYSRAPRTGSFILDPWLARNDSMPAYLDSQDRQTNKTDAISLVIPFGLGLKFNITKNLGGVIEVMVRKTFADNIDNLDDPKRFQNVNLNDDIEYPAKFAHSISANNDWYATCTVSFLYQLWQSKGNCKIYEKYK
jgi:hypothetical protein